MKAKLKLGDSVIIKQGIKEPDFEEFEIGGWPGRVVEIDFQSDKDNILDTIEWDSFGDQGTRILKILANADQRDIMQCLQKWAEYLDKELSFPIAAIVAESDDNWLIRNGDKVLIKKLSHIEDIYGIIASIRLNGKQYEYPLCDPEAIDKPTTNFQLIDDYRTWFGNRR